MANSKFIGYGQTKNNYVLNPGFPVVYEKGDVAPIRVELYDVPEEDLTGPIDRLEGHPDIYCRKETEIILDDGSQHKAWLYFMDDEPPKNVSPNENGTFEWGVA